jgi:hypothetical protein
MNFILALRGLQALIDIRLAELDPSVSQSELDTITAEQSAIFDAFDRPEQNICNGLFNAVKAQAGDDIEVLNDMSEQLKLTVTPGLGDLS